MFVNFQTPNLMNLPATKNEDFQLYVFYGNPKINPWNTFSRNPGLIESLVS